jgi:hypothetical protein
VRHKVRLLLAAAFLLSWLGVARPSTPPGVALRRPGGTSSWDDFQIIEWQRRDAAQLATLKRLGVTAATVIANRDGAGMPVQLQIAPMLGNGLRWYVENIATDYYSAYHRWSPPHPVNWRFLDVQHRYQQDPNDQTALWRDPSFADPVWQKRIRDRLISTVHEQMRYRPLYYSLGDETGIADLSAFWDFDMSPGSLHDMRVWLRQTYGSLAALNAEWGSDFPHWEDVRPETTREAMRRTDDNFAPWADFKAWMDIAFARALRMGTDAVHRADPSALAAIEGAQVPSWGGYDYTLLVNTVDVMELDDVPLAHSLDPDLITLTTSFGTDARDLHDLWRNLLAGSRGLILWDSKGSIVRPDATLGERGQAYADTFKEIHSGIGHLLLTSTPQTDPIAILYSPPSFRTQWMLEQRPKGDAWMTRDAEAELSGNAAREAMRAYQRAVTHLGFQPTFLSPDMVQRGDLRRRGIRTLILPHAIALSPATARAINDFSGTVIADVQPGTFDAHSRKLPRSLIDIAHIHIVAPDSLGIGGPEPAIRANSRDTTLHTWQHGDATILAVQRDYADSPDETVTLTWTGPRSVTDLRSDKPLGRTDHISIKLDTVYPAILSLSP